MCEAIKTDKTKPGGKGRICSHCLLRTVSTRLHPSISLFSLNCSPLLPLLFSTSPRTQLCNFTKHLFLLSLAQRSYLSSLSLSWSYGWLCQMCNNKLEFNVNQRLCWQQHIWVKSGITTSPFWSPRRWHSRKSRTADTEYTMQLVLTNINSASFHTYSLPTHTHAIHENGRFSGNRFMCVYLRVLCLSGCVCFLPSQLTASRQRPQLEGDNVSYLRPSISFLL